MLGVEELGHVCRCGLAVLPGYPIGHGTMQTRMGREQSIRDPAVVDLRRRMALRIRLVAAYIDDRVARSCADLESANVVGGKRKARRSQTQAAAERFRHRLEGRLAVATPMLSAGQLV